MHFETVDSWKAVTQHQFRDLRSVQRESGRFGDQKTRAAYAPEHSERIIPPRGLGPDVRHTHIHEASAWPRLCGLEAINVVHLQAAGNDDYETRQMWRHGLEEFQPLGSQLRASQRHTGDVASRTRKALHDTAAHRIGAYGHHHRNRRGDLL